MHHAEDYKALISQQNHLVFVIKNQSDKAPREPYLVYNGEKHALLYRSPHDMLLLDYLHEDAAYLLKYATEVLIIETAADDDDFVVFDYKAAVKQV